MTAITVSIEERKIKINKNKRENSGKMCKVKN